MSGEAVVFSFVASGQERVLQALTQIASSGKSSADKVKSANENLARAVEASQKRISKAAEAEADKKLSKEERASKRMLKLKEDEAKKLAEIEKATTKVVEAERQKRSLQGIGKSVATGIGGVAAGAFALASGLATKASLESLKTHEMANRLSISRRKAGQEFVDPNALRQEWEKTAAATPGITAQQVGSGVKAFGGDLDTARRMQGVMATVSSATGGDIEEIAKVMGTLSRKFDIKSVEDMKIAMGGLVMKAKEGGTTITDAAENFGKFSTSAQRFGLDKSMQGASTMMGLENLAKAGTGSTAAGSKALEKTMNFLLSKAPQLKAQGINVFKDGQANLPGALVDLVNKTGGSNYNLKKSLLNKELGGKAYGAVSSLVDAYRTTFESTKGTQAEKKAAAEKAVADQMQRLTSIGAEYAEVEKDAAQAQKTAGAQLEGAWQTVVAAIGTHVTPQLVEMAPKLAAVVVAAAPLMETFAEVAGVAMNELAPALSATAIDLKNFLADIGIGKKETQIEKLGKAEKELNMHNRRMELKAVSGEGVSDEDLAKRRTLEGQVEGIKNNLFVTNSQIGGKNAEEFSHQFALASGAAPGSAEYKDKVAQAAMIERSIQKDPMHFDASHATGLFQSENVTKAVQSRVDQVNSDKAQAAFERAAAATERNAQATEQNTAALRSLAGAAGGKPLSQR